MSAIKLKPGESVFVSAMRGDEKPDQGLPTPPGGGAPVDPGYGINVGLGPVHPGHPIVLPPQIPSPPSGPVNPAWGIDEDLGWLRPGGGPIIPPTEPPPEGQGPNWTVKVAWTPVTGWIVVAVPEGPHVTPSSTQPSGPQPKRAR